MQASQIVDVFNRLFSESYQTRLVGNAREPYYEAGENRGGVIYFCSDYASSAVHEVAHWCMAGSNRRRQNDYGYWYADTRDAQNQKQFESVEAKPQALEWVFSQALGITFKVSADNLELPDYDLVPFRGLVRQALEARLSEGLPPRAAIFAAALADLGQGSPYDRIEFFAPLPD